ncbi:MAG: FtsX-like permease family protein [Acidobacteriota bacterium]
MTTLLHRSSIRYLLHHRLQLVLAILGIALGVAVVVAIDIANGSAQRAFELSSDAVIGKATHQIVEVSGRVPDRIYQRLRLDLKLRTVAPVVESDFTIPGSDIEVLTLLGVDPFAEREFRSYLSASSGAELDLASFLLTPGAVLLEPVTAERLGVDKGESFLARLPNREVRLQLVGYLQPEDDLTRDAISNLAVVDIATAQEALGLVGRLSRIDLILPAGRAGELELESIREALPAGIAVRESSSNRDIADQMTRAFRLNLQALSLLALFCGAFLIYNTMTFAVVQRRSLIAVLRAIGTTRRQILSMILIEAVFLGIVGTVIGQAAGLALGRVLVGLVTQTINDLYFVVSVRSIAIEPWTLVKGAAIGLGTTLAAALAPALEATSTPPRRALETIELERRNVARRVSARAGLSLDCRIRSEAPTCIRRPVRILDGLGRPHADLHTRLDGDVDAPRGLGRRAAGPARHPRSLDHAEPNRHRGSGSDDGSGRYGRGRSHDSKFS